MNPERKKNVDVILRGRRVPLYFVLIIFLILLGGAGLAAYKFKEQIISYSVLLPKGDDKPQEFVWGSWPLLKDENFFASVKKEFIDGKVSFIEADLSSMNLSFYENGELKESVAIATKGKEGSWWETPAGLYKAEAKSKSYYSSLGNVYMPWSIQFQGNFFIHGWPYYEGGEPVKSNYSGGCVRLQTQDAEKIYSLVKTGMPILVFEKDFSKDSFNYRLKTPEIKAKSFLAIDLKNNFVFAEKNSTEVLPIASITKLITALITTEYINLDKSITISERMLTSTSKPRLKVGESVSAFNLLYPLLLESSNEAAEALAYYLGPIRFVDLMNAKAKAVGMVNAKFADASGKSPENIASAQDLFNLAKYLYNNRSFILKMSANKLNSSAYGPPKFKDLKSFNGFDDNPEFLGGKVGLIPQAKETILAIFEIEIGGVKRPIAIIVLGSEDRIGDAEKILNWTKENYF